MKKLIFLLFPVFSYGQITINKTFGTAATSSVNATSFGFGPSTFTVGKLYLFITATTGTTNPGTISATTLTWDAVVSTGNSTRRIQVFRCLPSLTATGESVSLGTFGGGSTGHSETIWEITGMDASGTNGSGAIIQTTTGGATGTDPTLTLSSLLGRNAVIALFFNDLNPFGGTNESGWAEDFDNGYATPDAGTYITSRINTTDNTPSVTASSSTWIGVALEIKASGRRAVIIN